MSGRANANGHPLRTPDQPNRTRQPVEASPFTQFTRQLPPITPPRTYNENEFVLPFSPGYSPNSLLKTPALNRGSLYPDQYAREFGGSEAQLAAASPAARAAGSRPFPPGEPSSSVAPGLPMTGLSDALPQPSIPLFVPSPRKSPRLSQKSSGHPNSSSAPAGGAVVQHSSDLSPGFARPDLLLPTSNGRGQRAGGGYQAWRLAQQQDQLLQRQDGCGLRHSSASGDGGVGGLYTASRQQYHDDAQMDDAPADSATLHRLRSQRASLGSADGDELARQAQTFLHHPRRPARRKLVPDTRASHDVPSSKRASYGHGGDDAPIGTRASMHTADSVSSMSVSFDTTSTSGHRQHYHHHAASGPMAHQQDEQSMVAAAVAALRREPSLADLVGNGLPFGGVSGGGGGGSKADSAARAAAHQLRRRSSGSSGPPPLPPPLDLSLHGSLQHEAPSGSIRGSATYFDSVAVAGQLHRSASVGAGGYYGGEYDDEAYEEYEEEGGYYYEEEQEGDGQEEIAAAARRRGGPAGDASHLGNGCGRFSVPRPQPSGRVQPARAAAAMLQPLARSASARAAAGSRHRAGGARGGGRAAAWASAGGKAAGTRGAVAGEAAVSAALEAAMEGSTGTASSSSEAAAAAAAARRAAAAAPGGARGHTPGLAGAAAAAARAAPAGARPGANARSRDAGVHNALAPPTTPHDVLTASGSQVDMPQAPHAVKRCNCKRSRCLKLYCDCFAAGQFCGELCACNCCHNNEENTDVVRAKRESIKARNPQAFQKKIQVDVVAGEVAGAQHVRGCNCKKSGCRKKYCECYQAGVPCGDACRCEGCSNPNGCAPSAGGAASAAPADTATAKEGFRLKAEEQGPPTRKPSFLSPVTPAVMRDDSALGGKLAPLYKRADAKKGGGVKLEF